MRGSRQKRRIFAKEFFLIWSGLTVAGLAIFCAFTVFFSVPKERVATTISTSTPAVFLFPHQDDEMFLGGEILRQLQSGRPVYAVMVTSTLVTTDASAPPPMPAAVSKTTPTLCTSALDDLL
jgi:hypothetical protein